jgi:DNA-binding CsgD family transcriptional regulator
MNNPPADTKFSDLIAYELLYLRRDTRALKGSQLRGDKYTVATLEVLLKNRSDFDNENPVKVNLFKCFHTIWTTSGQQFVDTDAGLRSRANGLLANLTANSREALLLRTIEDLSLNDIALIMQIDVDDVRTHIGTAYADRAQCFKGRVMIIEDEPIITVDLSAIVSGLGHDVVVSRTPTPKRSYWVANRAPMLFWRAFNWPIIRPIIDAVNDLLAIMEVSVIFITAFPERLLTGDRSEPAFLISRPFQETQVQSAVSQAMFFTSTETLNAQKAGWFLFELVSTHDADTAVLRDANRLRGQS